MAALGRQVYHVPWMQLGAAGIDVDATPEAGTERAGHGPPSGTRQERRRS